MELVRRYSNCADLQERLAEAQLRVSGQGERRNEPSDLPHNACMPVVTLTVPDYDPARGVIIQPEGGDVLIRHAPAGVEILADPAGLRDLARWCLALADEQVPNGAHVHPDPGTIPLTASAAPLMIGREDQLAEPGAGQVVVGIEGMGEYFDLGVNLVIGPRTERRLCHSHASALHQCPHDLSPA